MANRKTAAAKRSNGGGVKGKKKSSDNYGNTGMSKKEFKKYIQSVRRANKESKVTSKKKGRPSARF